MLALLKDGQVVGLYATAEHAHEQNEMLKVGGTVEPATFGNDPGRLKLKVNWKLEKFAGDTQSPENLLETIEGEF